MSTNDRGNAHPDPTRPGRPAAGNRVTPRADTSLTPDAATPRPAPAPAAESAAGSGRGVVSLQRLLARPVTGRDARPLGRVDDVIVRLRPEGYPRVTGLVADIGGRRLFVPAEKVPDWRADPLALSTARLDLREFERRDGEVLLRHDILGHRLIDTTTVRLVRAYDLELAPAPHPDQDHDGQGGNAGTGDEPGWVLVGVDTHPTRWWHRLWHGLRHPAAASEDSGADHAGHAPGCRDWSAFEALIGHTPSVLVRAPLSRLRRLKTPQIADLLEEASRDEQAELLAQVHTDPELEADVFEELDDNDSARLLRERTDPDVAAVLAHMRADDAADALMDLPQERRLPVLELLPAGQRSKVRSLLGFNPTSAGGLMGLDHLAVPDTLTVADALDAVRLATEHEPQALATVFTLDQAQRLAGAVGLVALTQADPTAVVSAVAEANPVRVGPETDLPDVAVLMTDYNLLNLPVVDDEDRLLGVITVDDALEATVPGPWRRREPPTRPESADPEPGPAEIGPAQPTPRP